MSQSDNEAQIAPGGAISPVPFRINLGSGKSWHEQFLNIDISEYWRPDILADFNEAFLPPEGRVFETDRFGSVHLRRGQFKHIVAHDVLEHIREVGTCVTNCLELLDFGGILEVLVPHDLSHGAWRDPTHVRAFNEGSWLYYTEWFWWMGWMDARFELAKLDFEFSDLGTQMSQEGADLNLVLRTPRAVDNMHAYLRKIPLSSEDREEQARQMKRPER